MSSELHPLQSFPFTVVDTYSDELADPILLPEQFIGMQIYVK
jgi:hypothetical protein